MQKEKSRRNYWPQQRSVDIVDSLRMTIDILRKELAKNLDPSVGPANLNNVMSAISAEMGEALLSISAKQRVGDFRVGRV